MAALPVELVAQAAHGAVHGAGAECRVPRCLTVVCDVGAQPAESVRKPRTVRHSG